MLNRKSIMAYGIILCILVLAGLVYWFSFTVPTQSEIESVTEEVVPVDQNILTSKQLEKIKQGNINGNLPIDTSDYSLGRANPFN